MGTESGLKLSLNEEKWLTTVGFIFLRNSKLSMWTFYEIGVKKFQRKVRKTSITFRKFQGWIALKLIILQRYSVAPAVIQLRD